MFFSFFWRLNTLLWRDFTLFFLLFQEERFLPAPDVTRRLGTSTPIAKQDPGASPPYYRSASAASSSSNSAASSSEYYLHVRPDLYRDRSAAVISPRARSRRYVRKGEASGSAFGVNVWLCRPEFVCFERFSCKLAVESIGNAVESRLATASTTL